jgi:hypothetical protein
MPEHGDTVCDHHRQKTGYADGERNTRAKACILRPPKGGESILFTRPGCQGLLRRLALQESTPSHLYHRFGDSDSRRLLITVVPCLRIENAYQKWV